MLAAVREAEEEEMAFTTAGKHVALWLLVCTNVTVQTSTQLCQATANPV